MSFIVLHPKSLLNWELQVAENHPIYVYLLPFCHCEAKPWQSQPLNLNLVVYETDRVQHSKYRRSIQFLNKQKINKNPFLLTKKHEKF